MILSEKTVTGVYAIIVDPLKRDIILLNTPAEDVVSAGGQEKQEMVALGILLKMGFPPQSLWKVIRPTDLSVVSGKVEVGGELFLGEVEDPRVTLPNLRREIEEETGMKVGLSQFDALRHVSGNTHKREQIAPQRRGEDAFSVWSVGYWLALTDEQLQTLEENRQVTRVPIAELQQFLYDNALGLRPSTLLFLWDLLYELEMEQTA